MSATLDQVVFGWSEAGLEGRNRLQLVASSEGWRANNRYRRAAMRLCRLDAPADRDPISFGWVDLGGRRFVFQRRMVASLRGDARRLLAHVVAGPPADLPVDLILRAFDSRFWWSGEELEPVLAPAHAEDLAMGWTEARRPAEIAVAEPLMGHILAAGAGVPVTFEGTPHEMFAALWGVHERLPSLLDTVSCSTYESGQMATWFDVVGLDGRPRPPGSLSCSREASQPRYSRSQLADLETLVSVAVGSRSTRDAEGPRVYRETLRVSERIAVGNAHAIPPLLTRPATLSALLSSDLGARGVAEAIWSLEQQTWPRLSATDGSVVTRLDRLARVAADVARPQAGASLGLVARRLHTINPKTAPAYAERVLRRRAAGQLLPTPDEDFLAVVMHWAATASLETEVMGALAGWVDQHLSGALLVDKRVPAMWRYELFGLASERGILEVEDYLDLATQHPTLFEYPGWLPKDQAKVCELASCPRPLAELVAAAVAAQWPSAEVVRLLLELRRRGRLESAATLLDALCREESSSVSPAEFAQLWTVLEELATASRRGEVAIGLYDLPWGLHRRDPSSRRWIATAAGVMYRGRGNADQRSRDWLNVIGSIGDHDRAALTQIAVHDLAITSQTDWALAGHLRKLPLHEVPRDERAASLFTALERRTGRAEQLVPVLLLALSSAVVRSGVFKTRVTAGRYESVARAQVARILADDPAALVEKSKGPSAVARWLRAATPRGDRTRHRHQKGPRNE